MEAIRAFRREDIPQVLELFRTAFLQTEKTAAGLETYFDRVFFESPWRDEDLPSFVHLNAAGSVIGFVGVQPRPLLLRGRRASGRASAAPRRCCTASSGSGPCGRRVIHSPGCRRGVCPT